MLIIFIKNFTHFTLWLPNTLKVAIYTEHYGLPCQSSRPHYRVFNYNNNRDWMYQRLAMNTLDSILVYHTSKIKKKKKFNVVGGKMKKKEWGRKNDKGNILRNFEDIMNLIYKMEKKKLAQLLKYVL